MTLVGNYCSGVDWDFYLNGSTDVVFQGNRYTPAKLSVVGTVFRVPVIAGSRAENVALTSLLSQLAAAGLIVDTTTAM
jgi:hypothetical protein